MSNKFGKKFTFTTFGESHGSALGCVVDGVPAGLNIDKKFIQSELNRRKPGQNEFSTSRKEDDKIEILSGVFEGLSTGTPIALIVFNEDNKTKDYENIKNIFRPGHADFTYFHKYGLRDYRGGGRSSARETVMRVAVGAIAKLMLNEIGLNIKSGVCEIAGMKANKLDFNYAVKSEIYALDKQKEQSWKDAIMGAKKSHDSVGGVAHVKATNIPTGLGEPLYYKLDALLAEAMMGINGVKAVEIGEGFNSSSLKGSQNNDQIKSNGFLTNHSGGVLGGISNGETIDLKIYFKPTPSIFIDQNTVDTSNIEQKCTLKGRHDPCIAIRGSVVAESMTALVLADMVLLNMSSKMKNITKIYL
ncbi:MAG: chorismate synthase [Sulfurospirillum sp.]|nr:chorismate synthase [Sulfurospirillum sp.]MBL0702994.1 chorismate synthase [Sulfurospirillum sp.]